MARPPRLPDSEILALIAELRGRQPVLTGTRVREELRNRFGVPCGVARVYRLLHAAATPIAASSPTPAAAKSELRADISQLQEELGLALERARLAEYREEHHQARWAGEIHQLREQVHAHREAAHRLPVLEREIQDRSRELAAAYRRITDLETQLRTLTGG